MRTTFTILAASVSIMMFASVCLADDGGSFRIFISQANPSGEWSGIVPTEFGDFPATIEADSTTGVSFTFEQRFNKHVGLEAGLAYYDYDLDLSIPEASTFFGSVAAMPFWAGVNGHFGGKRVDVYLGALVHATLWGDIEGPYGTADTDPEVGFGAVAGFEVPFGSSKWALEAAVRYMDVPVGDESVKIDVNPMFFELGIGRRW